MTIGWQFEIIYLYYYQILSINIMHQSWYKNGIYWSDWVIQQGESFWTGEGRAGEGEWEGWRNILQLMGHVEGTGTPRKHELMKAKTLATIKSSVVRKGQSIHDSFTKRHLELVKEYS